jgi:hypothetical protein
MEDMFSCGIEYANFSACMGEVDFEDAVVGVWATVKVNLDCWRRILPQTKKARDLIGQWLFFIYKSSEFLIFQSFQIETLKP